MIRKGQRNGSTYWYCNDCKRYSSGCKMPSQEAIFNRYSQGTFTIKQLSEVMYSFLKLLNEFVIGL